VVLSQGAVLLEGEASEPDALVRLLGLALPSLHGDEPAGAGLGLRLELPFVSVDRHELFSECGMHRVLLKK